MEAKFADNSSSFWRSKQTQGKSTTSKSKWNKKKKFVGCYAPWLKDSIYGVTNISVEILMYIQIFILVKAASFIEGIRRSTSVIKNEPTKQHRYFDETKEKSGNYCK